jgi:hypothetical protein
MPDTPSVGDTVMIDPAEVEPNPWNPNRLPDHIMEALTENIRRHGFNQSITIRRKDDDSAWQIVDGEHRWEAASQIGLEAIPCTIVEMDDSTAKSETLAMNKLRGEMEPVEVAKILKEIEEDISLSELASYTGYTEEELDGLRNLLDYDWNKLNRPDGDGEDPEPDDEKWVDLRYRVPKSVELLFKGEVERLKRLRETQHDHLALEVMAVNSSQVTASEVR